MCQSFETLLVGFKCQRSPNCQSGALPTEQPRTPVLTICCRVMMLLNNNVAVMMAIDYVSLLSVPFNTSNYRSSDFESTLSVAITNFLQCHYMVCTVQRLVTVERMHLRPCKTYTISWCFGLEDCRIAYGQFQRYSRYIFSVILISSGHNKISC